ncbi:MAG: hypothetical protein LBQ62_02775 [Candidatus Accumulibacter sp.]|jgi:hypothetical protein|nr:hypothetical protein [Accumulibacter sp.]
MDALQAGDVLLSHGGGTISNVIRLIDGGHYSHASLYDGEEIIEAGPCCVVRTPLETGIQEQEYVDAYRFRSVRGEALSSPGWPADPVIERAHHYLEKRARYANNPLYLLGALIFYKQSFDLFKRSFTRMEKSILQAMLEQVLDLFQRISNGSQVKPVVSCSELVYRSFHEARGRRYSLIWDARDILRTGPRTIEVPRAPVSQDGQALGAEYQHMLERLETLFQRINPSAPLITDSGIAEIAPEIVGPRILERSPSLRLIGRLNIRKSPQWST